MTSTALEACICRILCSLIVLQTQLTCFTYVVELGDFIEQLVSLSPFVVANLPRQFVDMILKEFLKAAKRRARCSLLVGK